jgi:mercuric ion transport protein
MATQTVRNEVSQRSENPLLAYLSLFTSLGTLLCCALPSLLVLLGLGATVASFLTAVPWLVTLARHKAWVFTVSGALIASDFFYIYWLSPRLKAHGESCSIANGPTACDTATHISRVALWVAAAIYAVGFFTAYLLGPILVWLNP